MPKRSGKAWWNGLTDKEKSDYISKKERSRRSSRPIVAPGTRESLPNGLLKIWRNSDSYTIYKPSMLDSTGNPLPEYAEEPTKGEITVADEEIIHGELAWLFEDSH